jgi:hypothetical protein
MSELDEDTRRVWYQKGYHQAERDNEVLVKKLVKDITDLSAQRLDLINDTGIFSVDQEELIAVRIQRDNAIDYLKEALEVLESEYEGTDCHQALIERIRELVDSDDTK